MSYRTPGPIEPAPPRSSRRGSFTSRFTGSQSPMTQQVEKATSDLLMGPDWTMNMEICDALNRDPGQTREAMKALRKHLAHKSTRTVLLSLTLLEAMIKNCGAFVHQQVAEKDILPEMVKLVRKKADMRVRDKVLELLESWQEAFGGPEGQYPQYWRAYSELQGMGVSFPRRSLDESTPVFTPPPRGYPGPTPGAYGQPAPANYGSPGGYGAPAGGGGGGGPADPPQGDGGAMTLSEIGNVRSSAEVLSEMLTAVDPNDPRAVHDEVIADLAAQARTGQQRVASLVSTTADEEMMRQGLALNDELTKVLAKHDAMVGGRPAESPAEGPPAAGLARFDHEEDAVGEGEGFGHLAHRSTLRERIEATHPPAASAAPAPPAPPHSAYDRNVADLLMDGSPAAPPTTTPAPAPSPFGDPFGSQQPFQSTAPQYQQQTPPPPPSGAGYGPPWAGGNSQTTPPQLPPQAAAPAAQAAAATPTPQAGAQTYLPGFPPLTIYSTAPSPPREQARYEQPPGTSGSSYDAPVQGQYAPTSAHGGQAQAPQGAGGAVQYPPPQQPPSQAAYYGSTAGQPYGTPLSAPIESAPPAPTAQYGASPPPFGAFPPPADDAAFERSRQQQQQQQQPAPRAENPFGEDEEFKALPALVRETPPASLPYGGTSSNQQQQQFPGFQQPQQGQMASSYVAPWAVPQQAAPPGYVSATPPPEQQPSWTQALDQSQAFSQSAPPQQQAPPYGSPAPPAGSLSPAGGAYSDLPPPAPSSYTEGQRYFQQGAGMGGDLGRRASYPPGGTQEAAAVYSIATRTGQMSLDGGAGGMRAFTQAAAAQQQQQPAGPRQLEQRDVTSLKPTLQQLAKNQNPVNDLFGDLVDLSSARKQLSPPVASVGPISKGPPLRRPNV